MQQCRGSSYAEGVSPDAIHRNTLCASGGVEKGLDLGSQNRCAPSPPEEGAEAFGPVPEAFRMLALQG